MSTSGPANARGTAQPSLVVSRLQLADSPGDTCMKSISHQCARVNFVSEAVSKITFLFTLILIDFYFMVFYIILYFMLYYKSVFMLVALW